MVNEIHGEDEQDTSESSEERAKASVPCYPSFRKDDDPYKLAREVKYKQLQELERIQQTYPFRNIGETSRGVDNRVVCAFCDEMGRHFSDPCAQVIKGAERCDIIMRKGLCKHCLGTCPLDRCRFPRRECWYCTRIQGTMINDLIPYDEGHHRALCPVPDARSAVRERINELQRRIKDWLPAV
ncbi:hypothetical protein Y032_0094g2690 [Ancylostoma ceylanicum]|uniref:Uncharacterized protein n=1 Tax=Ancylostoma ceylanicum TaxID=53326 RepID=A0A016TKV2_9BILA|nr:hypothetical protein Y032_0094g2690 [Ancylostoma ceylanicum]